MGAATEEQLAKALERLTVHLDREDAKVRDGQTSAQVLAAVSTLATEVAELRGIRVDVQALDVEVTHLRQEVESDMRRLSKRVGALEGTTQTLAVESAVVRTRADSFTNEIDRVREHDSWWRKHGISTVTAIIGAALTAAIGWFAKQLMGH